MKLICSFADKSFVLLVSLSCKICVIKYKNAINCAEYIFKVTRIPTIIGLYVVCPIYPGFRSIVAKLFELPYQA